MGVIGERITVDVTLVSDYSYESHYGYQTQTNYIYTMRDSDGNVFVWKTTALLVNLVVDDTDNSECIYKGDTMQITGTVKEHSEYNGVKQTVLTRCKFSLIAHKPDETTAKAQEQALTITAEDLVWEMPYRQYKEHYADCETVIGSYDKERGSIKVIIRKGRLVNSGVRGKHFSGYQFANVEGTAFVTYRAVSEDNARKQMLKEFPENSDWICVKIYR